ncbi:MAG: VOC family protein [Campylobacterota bacterium]|nr:VOC family protein [Campylobacterota bacterium]
MIEPKSSFPVFTVKDLTAAKNFYTENLGFTVAFDGDWYIHLISTSGVQIGFLLPDQPSQPPIFQKPYLREGVIFSLEVEDVDASYTVAKSKSLNIVLELQSEEWGQRHFSIEDPNGIYIDILQYFEPTDEYQTDYVS